MNVNFFDKAKKRILIVTLFFVVSFISLFFGIQQNLNKSSDLFSIIPINTVNATSTENLNLIPGGNTVGIKVCGKDDENIAGIGTITFYKADSKEFGALGHSISSKTTDKNLEITSGKLFTSSISAIQKGKRGVPGELIGTFIDNNESGIIEKNSDAGVFGKIVDDTIIPDVNSVEVLPKLDIVKGDAVILTDIVDGEVREYGIKILKIYNNSKNLSKGILIKITDNELLNVTGGIIQGMSGSPILQNGKIIGAVTHVLVNDPTRGYGISIEDMLKE